MSVALYVTQVAPLTIHTPNIIYTTVHDSTDSKNIYKNVNVNSILNTNVNSISRDTVIIFVPGDAARVAAQADYVIS